VAAGVRGGEKPDSSVEERDGVELFQHELSWETKGMRHNADLSKDDRGISEIVDGHCDGRSSV